MSRYFARLAARVAPAPQARRAATVAPLETNIETVAPPAVQTAPVHVSAPPAPAVAATVPAGTEARPPDTGPRATAPASVAATTAITEAELPRAPAIAPGQPSPVPPSLEQHHYVDSAAGPMPSAKLPAPGLSPRAPAAPRLEASPHDRGRGAVLAAPAAAPSGPAARPAAEPAAAPSAAPARETATLAPAPIARIAPTRDPSVQSTARSQAGNAAPTPSIRIGTIALEIRTPPPPAVAPALPRPAPAPVPAPAPATPPRFPAHRHYLR